MLWSDLNLRISKYIPGFIKPGPSISTQAVCSSLDSSSSGSMDPKQRQKNQRTEWVTTSETRQELVRRWQELLSCWCPELPIKYRWRTGHSTLGNRQCDAEPPNNFNTFPISSEMQQSVVWDRFHYYTVNLKWRYVFLVRKWPHSIKECHCPEQFSFYLILNIIYKLVNPKFWSPALTTHLRSRPTFITAYFIFLPGLWTGTSNLVCTN